MSTQTWASIARRSTPAQAPATDSGGRAIANAISQRNATKHAAVKAKQAAAVRRRQHAPLKSLSYYEDRDMARVFVARLEMARDAGGISKNLAADLAEGAKKML
jgi:hypothetical protein